MGITDLRNRYGQAFQEFWRVYPKHSKISDAELAFFRACEGSKTRPAVDPMQLILKARAYAKTIDLADLRYVPGPAAWLNDGAYENADLFASEGEEERAWFRKAWEEADVAAVENRYGVTFEKVYPPDDVTTDAQFRFWFREACRLWIAETYRSKAECGQQQAISEQSSLF